MKKSTSIIIGAVGVVVVAIGAYAMSGGSLFQGRLSYFDKTQLRPKQSFIASVPLCLTLEEYNKKYPPIPATPGTDTQNNDDNGNGTPAIGAPGTGGVNGGHQSGGTNNGTDPKQSNSTDTSNTNTSTDGKDDKGNPITVNPPVIGGTGSKGGTVAKGNTGNTNNSGTGTTSSPAGNNNEKVVFEECSCKRDGFVWYVKGSDGKKEKHQCYVNFDKCLDPDFKCPDGTQADYPALWDLCKAKKTKNCFAAGKPDNTSKMDAMCKALTNYKNWTCVTQDQCKEYAQWLKAGTLTENITKNGLSMNDPMTCADMYSSIWYGK